MEYFYKTEEIKTAMDHFFNDLPCPARIIDTLSHWKSNYWNLAPHDVFQCELFVSDFFKTKGTDFMMVMFFEHYIENLESESESESESENDKRPFLNSAEKLEIADIKQFIVDSNLLPYLNNKDVSL